MSTFVVLLGIEEDAEIEVAPPEPFDLLGRGQVRHVSLERRLRLVQGSEKTEQLLDREVQRTADAELRPDAARLACFGDGTVKSCEHVARFFRKDPARFRLGHDATRAPEQGDAEFVLELPDRLGERWLRDVEPLGGPSEVEFLADREEVAQVPKLDRRIRRSLAWPSS